MIDSRMKGTLTSLTPRRKIFLLRTSTEALNDWHLRDRILHRIDSDLKSISNLDTNQSELSWWEHNRHLTLAINFNDEDFEFIGGIYFRRRLKSSKISPIYVQEERDCLELLFTFLSYVRRSYCERSNDAERNKMRENMIELASCIKDKIDFTEYEKPLQDRFGRLLAGLETPKCS